MQQKFVCVTAEELHAGKTFNRQYLETTQMEMSLFSLHQTIYAIIALADVWLRKEQPHASSDPPRGVLYCT